MKIQICGAGIAGLFSALALSGKGHKIILLERDAPPPIADDDLVAAERAFFEWDRRGAGQFRHPHAFLGLMCSLIESHYPDLLAALLAAGARRVSFVDMLPPALRESYVPEPGDEKLWVLSCRRATIERVIYRHVAGLPDVEMRPGAVVKEILVEPGDVPEIAGVCLADGQRLLADVTVDATGRTSRFPHLLQGQGVQVPEEKEDAEIVYYTRYYRLKPGASEPGREGGSANGDLGYMKYGTFPGDNGHFAIIICLPVAEQVLRKAVMQPALFDEMCAQIPGLAPWLDGRAEPTTVPAGIGDIHAVWRRYAPDGNPLLLNFFAVGDACLRTNPLYGRGCSTSLLHAHLLRDVIASGGTPRERAVLFADRTEKEIRAIYAASLADDQRAIRRAGMIISGEQEPEGAGKALKGAFGDAISAAARENIYVMRGVMRTFNLIEAPGTFLRDWKIRGLIARYMLRGRKRNQLAKKPAGPGRNEMIAFANEGLGRSESTAA